MLNQGIRPGKSSKLIESGEIIHLVGEPVEIWSRLITKRKETSWPPEKIAKLQSKSLELYEPLMPKKIHSTGRREVDVIRDVARIIFSTEYSPVDIDAQMRNIANA